MSDLILNPASNRYIKKTSQTGKRLLKKLMAETHEIQQPIQQPEIHEQPEIKPPKIKESKALALQKALTSKGVEIVSENRDKFDNLSDKEMDRLFKKLLLKKL